MGKGSSGRDDWRRFRSGAGARAERRANYKRLEKPSYTAESCVRKRGCTSLEPAAKQVDQLFKKGADAAATPYRLGFNVLAYIFILVTYDYMLNRQVDEAGCHRTGFFSLDVDCSQTQPVYLDSLIINGKSFAARSEGDGNPFFAANQLLAFSLLFIETLPIPIVTFLLGEFLLPLLAWAIRKSGYCCERSQGWLDQWATIQTYVGHGVKLAGMIGLIYGYIKFQVEMPNELASLGCSDTTSLKSRFTAVDWQPWGEQLEGCSNLLRLNAYSAAFAAKAWTPFILSMVGANVVGSGIGLVYGLLREYWQCTRMDKARRKTALDYLWTVSTLGARYFLCSLPVLFAWAIGEGFDAANTTLNAWQCNPDFWRMLTASPHGSVDNLEFMGAEGLFPRELKITDPLTHQLLVDLSPADINQFRGNCTLDKVTDSYAAFAMRAELEIIYSWGLLAFLAIQVGTHSVYSLPKIFQSLYRCVIEGIRTDEAWSVLIKQLQKRIAMLDKAVVTDGVWVATEWSFMLTILVAIVGQTYGWSMLLLSQNGCEKWGDFFSDNSNEKCTLSLFNQLISQFATVWVPGSSVAMAVYSILVVLKLIYSMSVGWSAFEAAEYVQQTEENVPDGEAVNDEATEHEVAEASHSAEDSDGEEGALVLVLGHPDPATLSPLHDSLLGSAALPPQQPSREESVRATWNVRFFKTLFRQAGYKKVREISASPPVVASREEGNNGNAEMELSSSPSERGSRLSYRA